MSEAGDISDELKVFIEAQAPERGRVSIANLRPAPAGSSTENWFFDADWGDGPEPLLLRRAPKTEVVLVDRSAEFAVLQRLNGSGIPSPRAWWQGMLGGRFAMIMQRCKGRAERMVLTDRNRMGLNEEARVGLAREIAAVLADLHSLPAQSDEEDPVEGALAPYRAKAAALPDEAAAELRLGLWWLEANKPAATARAIVHGDYRPANILIHDGRISAVLDWEFAHTGDPAEDIGWYFAAIYRGQHFVEGRFGPDDFLKAYEARRGTTVDRAAVAWWSVFALQKLATIAIETLRAFLDGDDSRMIQSPDRHLSALMRAVARNGELDGLQ
ncbi:MAG: phosphotransferase family protein [Flavobacteriaceae bacterium]